VAERRWHQRKRGKIDLKKLHFDEWGAGRGGGGGIEGSKERKVQIGSRKGIRKIEARRLRPQKGKLRNGSWTSKLGGVETLSSAVGPRPDFRMVSWVMNPPPRIAERKKTKKERGKKKTRSGK